MRTLSVVVPVMLLCACAQTEVTDDASTVLSTNASLSPSTTATADRADRSLKVLQRVIEKSEPGCSAAVGIEGKVVWSGARGMADLNSGTAITADTAFDIASVSKQFTATAALLLVGAGKLSLGASVADYVPGLPEWSRTVTISELIHQNSGIPDYIDLLSDAGYQDSDRTTNADALKALAQVQELEFEPGTRWNYSNSNYLLLGVVVEAVSGTSLADFLSAEVFTPLGLDMVLDPAKRVPTLAVSYTWEDGSYTVARSAWEQTGDGSIQTTPGQLVIWGDNYRTGAVGGPELLAAQVDGAVETGEETGERYGAGISIGADGSLEHDGSWDGFLTDFAVSAARSHSVAVSCNSDHQDPTAIAGELAEIWR
ncbi:serine hydrolase domain-containing protein [Mycobacterium sp. M26]|uniref:serine hydrolase domain-containing protein n=1 Tax=Mycobacterium sp. M26 TaxID=1762962 RepID=UPI001E502F61|nr:serine hydrolase domain-containing protein [Mycobacterium sp. M26]